MSRRISRDAAQAVPNLYNAAVKYNYPQEVADLINQVGLAMKKTGEIDSLPIDQAKLEFRSLDKDIQNVIKSLNQNKSKEWTKEDPSLLFQTAGFLKDVVVGVSRGALSPLIELFNTADKYDRGLSAPYVSKYGVTFKGKEFKKATLREGYSGKNIYNQEAIEKLSREYGEEAILVARGLHANLNYDEIIQDYGSVDDKILGAISFASNEPEKFNEIFDKVKLAQTSFGRDRINNMDTDAAIPEDAWYNSDVFKFFVGDLSNPKIQTEYKKISSGVLDAIFSLGKDPMTYMSGGLLPVGKGVLKVAPKVGLKLVGRAERLKYFGKNGDVESIFADPKVRELWDFEVGPKLKAIAEEKSEPKKVNLIRQFGLEHWELRNAETIDLFINKKMFNARAAHTFFRQTQDLSKIMSGRVDGLMSANNGIPYAKRSRRITSAAAIALDGLFNPSSVSKFTDEAVKVLEKRNDDAQALLNRIGTDVDESLVPGSTFRKEIDELQNDAENLRKGLYAVGQKAARTPFGGVILHGEDSIKTIETFKNQARLLFDRDLVDALALRYLKLGEEGKRGDQIIILRGLYIGIMLKAGLGGTPAGRQFIKDEISRIFSDTGSFANAAKTAIPEQGIDIVSPRVLEVQNNVPVIKSQGVFNPVALTEGVAALDYLSVIRQSSPVKMRLSSKGRTALAIPGFIARSKFIEGYTNWWVRLNLFPRLGPRAAIDEAVILGLGADGKDLLGIVSRRGHRLGKVGTTYTGSTSSVGPFFKGLYQKATKTGAYGIDAEKRMALAQRAADKKAKSLGLKEFPIERLTAEEIKQELIAEVAYITGTKVGSKEFDYITDGFLYSPNYLDSMVSSLASRSTLSGVFREQDIVDTIFTPTALTQALRNLNVGRSKEWRTLPQSKLDELGKDTGKDYRTLAHLSAMNYLFSGGNRIKLVNGKSYDPSIAFFAWNGLREAEDWRGAFTMLMERIGVTYIPNPAGKPIARVNNPVVLKSFLSQFTEEVIRKKGGESEIDIAEDLISAQLADMYTTFHGTGTKAGFNDGLYAKVRANHKALELLEAKEGRKIRDKWSRAFREITLDEFTDLTKGFKMESDIRTDLVFPEEASIYAWFEKTGNWMAESMDRVVNGIIRQPAVSVMYVNSRTGHSALEAVVKRKHLESILAESPKMNPDKAVKLADELARAQFTEIAQTEAVNTLLKFVDNPSIQSNFSLSFRFVSRFYRATEDFWRRYIRLLRNEPLRVVYRARLAHVGLDSRGDVYTNERGEEYFIMPTDMIINHAIEPVIRKLTGNENFIIPQYNQFTVGLRAINPSFAADAGQPTLSSPIAGGTVWALKSALGLLPDSIDYPGLKTIDTLDKYLLGSVGDNITFWRAVVPAIGTGTWDLATTLFGSKDSRRVSSLTMQAIAYNQANGLSIGADATVEEVAKYQKNLRITAMNIAAFQTILSRTSFTSFGSRESGDIPDYLKTGGMITPKSEFFAILTGIINNDPNIEDPYELALVTYLGKNPGKLAYTVSRDARSTRVVVQKTTQLKDWLMRNKVFVDKYKDAALIFAPQIGDFDSSVYTWLEAAEMINMPDVEKYLDSILVAEDKYKYYAVSDLIKEQLGTEARIPERRAIIEQGERLRKAIRKANPRLDALLDTPSDSQYESEKNILRNLTQAIYEPSTPIPAKERSVMRLAVDSMNDFVAFVTDESNQKLVNFDQLKYEKKESLQALIKELSIASPNVKEANRAIFKSIINLYTPEKVAAVRSSR